MFDDSGALSEIRQRWVFDEAFSAWTTQGLDTDGDGIVTSQEMQELADTNLEGLAEFDFYTFAGEGDANLELVPAGDAHMALQDGQVVLTFSLAPAEPYAVRHRLEIEVNDPEYYVAFSFAEQNGAQLENAPEGCSVSWHGPGELEPELANRLYELGPEVTELPPDLKEALRGVSNLATVTCEGGVATTAAEATEQVAKVKAPPFSAPPTEPGITMPRTGFLGWVNQQQQTFYGALTRALAALKSDANAFWVLGTLSFLYGIFHAAGPGHGKVVISSYVLAGEQELTRGIALSFAAALMQSMVAIAVVLVAAGALNLTSMALSNLTNLMAVGSYVLVVLLGAWLIVRHVFGLGHHHHHHDHDHDDEHVHAITPKHTHGSWQEQLGVVFSVGMRPCSGALVVLVFALSQGVLAAGVAATLLMGLGTALSVAVLASLAVFMKAGVGRLAGSGHGSIGASVIWWLELAGALVVFGFGIVLVLASLQ